MPEEITVRSDTRAALEEVAESIAERDSYCCSFVPQRPLSVASTASQLRRQLIKASRLVAQHDLRREGPLFASEEPDDWRWLTYIVDIDVVPIYDDGVTVSTSNLIVAPREIPHLVRFITATGTNNGLDLENHSFGYHFHFGSIRRYKLHRTDLLLTFKPTDTHASRVPLYAEKHGEGRYTSVDVAAIGMNKRRPIYDVCHAEMTKRGIENFKAPAQASRVFYP